MKIQSILLAAWSLLACVSCSKDEGGLSVKDLPDGKLTVGVKASGIGGTAYSAGEENLTLEGEMNINNLAVVVFDETGTMLLGNPVWEQASVLNGVATLTDVPVKATNARIVILSNTPKGAFDDVTSFNDFRSRLADLSTQSQSNLSMSTWVITTRQPLVEGDNYLGYASMGDANVNGIAEPVELTRIASRIDVLSMETDFAGTKLEGRRVRVDEVYIADRKTASRYFSEDYWEVVMADAHFDNGGTFPVGRVISDGDKISDTGFKQYVMENDASEKPTQLVVKATLLPSGAYAGQTRLFTATINADGLSKGYNHNYIKRNYVYLLHVTFGGDSFENIDNPPTPPVTPVEDKLDVQVEVVGWGPVDQPVEIE